MAQLMRPASMSRASVSDLSCRNLEARLEPSAAAIRRHEPYGSFPRPRTFRFPTPISRRALSVRSAADSSQSANEMDGIKVSPNASGKASGGDMMKLFNDAQQNMLYLNKQRLIALDELHKAEAEREYLAARVAQLQAEAEAGEAQRKLLEERLRAAELGVAAAPSSPTRSVTTAPGSKASGKAGGRAGEPASVWSRLLLRVDGLLLAKALTAPQAQALRGLAASRDARAADVYADVEPLEDAQVVRALLRLIDGSNRTLHVVHVCTELAPVAQAGSLATWMAGLCRALRKKGHLVEVVLPLYSSVDTSAIEDFREAPGEIMSFFDNKWHKNKIYTGTVHGLPVTFIHPLHPAAFFQRDHLYDYEDDFERFTYFTRAALEYVQQQGKQPDVLHLHNWHTAVGAPLFWDIYHHQGMPDTRILFTCHDARFQNAQPAGKLAQVGLDPSQLNRPDRLQDNRDPALVNLLKGGIVYSNKVTTVSPTYANDMKTRELGCGLDATVTIHSQKFAGLPSGLDQSTWDPTRDLALPVPITASDPMPGKAVARAEVRKRLGLPVIDSASGLERAVVAYVSPQIGEADVELIKGALACSLAYQAQFVLVGAARSPKVQMALEELQRVQQDRNAHLEIVYEDDLAHLVVAAAHVLLCPPLRDPSSHLPLVGARYGAVPVARQLMGSPDSLVDVDDPRRGASEGAGFFYASDKPADAVIALTRALKLLKADPQRWEAITKTAMSVDTSWDARSSDAYVHRLVVHREPKFTNFVEFRTYKVIYRRYAGLFFSLCVDLTDNELAYLESIHLFVEILDHFFSNVCELDLVFNFHKRQRPPTIDIPRKGCFTSSPAGTPDSAAEDALDGVVEVAESGACFAVACKRGRKAVMEDTYQALMGFAGRESDVSAGSYRLCICVSSTCVSCVCMSPWRARAGGKRGWRTRTRRSWGSPGARAMWTSGESGLSSLRLRVMDMRVMDKRVMEMRVVDRGVMDMRVMEMRVIDRGVMDMRTRHCWVSLGARAVNVRRGPGLCVLQVMVVRIMDMRAFFGVFDGHGGTAAAKFAASELASHVAQAAARRGAHASAAAVVEGYLETDRRFLGQNVASGTSCLTCWATPGRLLLAHAGDCKAVLVKGGRAVELTEDHRAGREDEQARITALGGFVDTATGMPRVQGILAVTRGIGDAHLKAFITPQPDVAQVRVGADCSALILASDGLWDVVAPQEGADVVMACVGTALEARAAAGEAKAAEREVGSAASALLGPPASPPAAAGTSEEVVATERPANLATLQQASAAVLAEERESESGGSKKVEGAFHSEKGIRDCSGGGGSERGGSERETREVDGEVLLSACQALVGMAAARGSRDDITVMLVSLAPFAESAAS
ncbi:unnamed protein product [Closterium sp. NIES-64]|nr:unnamed protein product [Closterium sp. NIES-64]